MNLHIKDFEGPLDLLLHLVKTAKMDIYDIDTTYIIDTYLDFINSIDKNDLDNASEYLVMASELIHLKSRVLLNLDTDDDKEEYEINSEEDLKNKLIEYERYKNVTESFKELEENRSEYYTKIPEAVTDFLGEENISFERQDPSILTSILQELQKRMNYQKPINTKITRKEISIVERTNYIRDYLKTRKRVKFFDLFEDYSKEVVVATFLSILNMCKNGEILLTQNNNFDDILIKRVENE